MWSVSQLPSDTLELHSVPRPLGGVLVFGANCLLRLNQVRMHARASESLHCTILTTWGDSCMCSIEITVLHTRMHACTRTHCIHACSSRVCALTHTHTQPYAHTQIHAHTHTQPTAGNTSLRCFAQLARTSLASIVPASYTAQLRTHHAGPVGEGATRPRETARGTGGRRDLSAHAEVRRANLRGV